MDEKSLYAHILNLTAPWQVKSLSLDENAGSVTVTVGIAENARLACSTCGKSCSVHDHRHRKWYHLDTCQFATIVEADEPGAWLPDVASSQGWPRKPVYAAVRIVHSLMAENQHR